MHLFQREDHRSRELPVDLGNTDVLVSREHVPQPFGVACFAGEVELLTDGGGELIDYLAKPVNTEQLLSALRMWLHR